MKLSFKNIPNFETIKPRGKAKTMSLHRFTKKTSHNMKKLQAGATWVLDQTVSDSPIREFLKDYFPRHKDFKKILSLAYFLILIQNNNVSFYESLRR